MKLSFDNDGSLTAAMETPLDVPGFVSAPEWYESGMQVYATSEGDIVEYSELQKEERAAQPSFPCRWSNVSMSWVDGQTAHSIKELQRYKIKVQRDAARDGGFEWDGSVFDSDEASRGLITLASIGAMADPVNFSRTWTLADNSTRTLSGMDMIGVATAMGNHLDTVQQTGRNLQALVEAIDEESPTLRAEVEAITWVIP